MRRGDDPAGDGEPETIGPYRLLQQLGEGGMGTVWLAEQSHPVRRRVALKIIRPGMNTKEFVARFETERQALAVMDHPNIAKVFDGGATDTGRPFFVMELVQGIPLTEYCDTHRLAVNDRLRLFADVCRAVQHAHLKGVIHRDLKPSNVLVCVKDQTPIVKVIDFGIAKATGGNFTDLTLVTGLGQAMGTPAYMSPEQAEGSHLDVDTRTDIYSLGVMLYELLTGSLPLDFGNMAQGAVLLAIRETDPKRPSVKYHTQDRDREIVARGRQTTPAGLLRDLAGDLDWIVLKAMEKDRTRRYETANGMAMDLERHLRNEPVLARPPTTRYRIQKFAQRNRAAVVAGALALLAIIGGAAAATVGFVRATQAQARATADAARAEQVSDFLVGLFRVSDPGESVGNTITARAILDSGATRIRRELESQPRVQARLMGTMGEAYRALGLYDAAQPLLERAVELGEGNPAVGQPGLAEALRQLGGLFRVRGRFAEAESLYRRSLAIQREAGGPETARLARTMGGLGATYMEAGKFPQADTLLHAELAILERELGPDDPEVASSLSNMGALYWLQSRFADAQPYFERAIASREKVLGTDHPDLADALSNLGATYYMVGEYDRAIAAYQRTRRIWEAALPPEHPKMASLWNNLAETYWVKKDYREAETYFGRALALKEKLYLPSHPSIAVTLRGLANVYRDEARYQDAEPLYRQALAIQEQTFGREHAIVAETLDGYAEMLRRAGREAEAGPIETRAKAIRTATAQ